MQQPWRLVTRGASLGVLTGVILASIYAALAVPALAFWLLLTNSDNGRLPDALIGVSLLSLCVGPFAFVLGILPAALLGLVGGTLLGAIFIPLHDHIDDMGRAAIGASLGLLIAASALLTLNEGLSDPIKPGCAGYYLFFFGLVGPSLLVIGGFAWVGWRLGHSKTTLVA